MGRPATVAGLFYPKEREALEKMLKAFFADIEKDISEVSEVGAKGDSLLLASPKDKSASTKHKIKGKIKAIIAPHAGYIYSGALAAKAYACLKRRANEVKRIILLGPSHHHFFEGVAVPQTDAFETPFGQLMLDEETLRHLLHIQHVRASDEIHRKEHSLEVHLPFIQMLFPQVELVPILIGQADPVWLQDLLKEIWGGEETLIVVSSDLSHFHSYEEAKRNDARTAQKIENYTIALTGEDACGFRGIQGLLLRAKVRDMRVERIGMYNSGDRMGGDKSRVVGYGAWAFYEDPKIVQKERKIYYEEPLLRLAREAIEKGLKGEVSFNVPYNPFIFIKGASFVTLKKNGQLRGCVGTLEAYQPLFIDVAQNAYRAAFQDGRFQPLREEELEAIELSISVLSAPHLLDVDSEEALLKALRPGIDGLIIESEGKRATYLPSVWEQLPMAELFLRSLKQKAGIEVDKPLDKFKAYIYQTVSF